MILWKITKETLIFWLNELFKMIQYSFYRERIQNAKILWKKKIIIKND